MSEVQSIESDQPADPVESELPIAPTAEHQTEVEDFNTVEGAVDPHDPEDPEDPEDPDDDVDDEVDDEVDEAEPAPSGLVTELEIERKLRVPALFRMPNIIGPETPVARVVARLPLELSATYYDTDDLRLARWGVTLRRREGGADAGWHLKLPVAGGHPGDREELQLPLEASPAGTPPEEFSTIVSALVRRAPLRAVATLRTERTPFLLRAADDRLIAELVDDVVSVLDGDRVAGRFREIEVEAREANIHELDAIIGVLVASGAEPGITSKAAHALGPRATAPPDIPVASTPSPRDPALAAVHAHLLTQARRLLLQDVRMRRDLPDSVHQMRVAARRLRSSLRTFRPLLDRQWADSLREELGWVAGELGLMRDTEVLLRRLDEHCDLIHDAEAAEAARAVVDRELGARLISAREASLQALSSTRYHALLDQLVSAVRHPAFTPLANEPARKALPALSWKAWNQLRHEAQELSHEVPVEQWHQTRITAKRARYAAEALESVFGDDATVLAKSLEGVTEILGEHQDASVARDTISELADLPGITGLEGWGLGLLHGVEVEAERDSRDQFAAVWARAVRAHKRSALR